MYTIMRYITIKICSRDDDNAQCIVTAGYALNHTGRHDVMYVLFF